MDAWEESLLDQHQQDEDATAKESYDNATNAMGGGTVAPEHVFAIAKDVGKGLEETFNPWTPGGPGAAGIPFRFLIGMQQAVKGGGHALRTMAPWLDLWEPGESPQWARAIGEHVNRYAEIGAKPETYTGAIADNVVSFGVGLWALKALRGGAKTIEVMKKVGAWDKFTAAAHTVKRFVGLQAILGGNKEGLKAATELRDSYLDYLTKYPELHELFSAVMTSEDPENDQSIAQAVAALHVGGQVGLVEVGLPAFKFLRTSLGRRMATEEAAKEFKLKFRTVGKDLQGKPGAILREPGPLELKSIGEREAFVGGVEGVKVPPPKYPRTPAPPVTPEAYAAKIVAEHERAIAADEFVGSSFGPKGEAAPATGYEGVTAAHEPLGKTWPTKPTQAQLAEEIGRSDVQQALKQPGVKYGTWQDPETGIWHGDVSTTSQTLEEARATIGPNQKSIWGHTEREGFPARPETVNTGMIGGGQSGWVTPDGKVHLNGRASHDDAARMLTKQYGLNPDAPAESLLGKGGVRWSTERGFTMNIEINQDPKAYAAARKVIMQAPDSTQTWVVDLSSSKVNKHGMRGSSEYFYSETPEDAIAKLDYFEKHGELPGRSKTAEFRGGPGPVHDLTGVSGKPQDFINELEGWKVKAEERLRKKGNRLSMTAGVPDLESVKDMAVIGAAMIARGVKKPEAIRAALIAKYGDVAKGNIEKVVSLSQEYYQTQLLDLAPSFHKQFDRAFSLAEKGLDTAEWYDGVPQVLRALGNENDQKMFIAMYSALSPLMDRAMNVDQALAVFSKWKANRNMGAAGFLRVLEEGRLGKSGQKGISAHMEQAWEAIESGKDTAFEDIFKVHEPDSSKINSFFRNIWHRIERPDEVTIDTKMYRVFGLPDTTSPKSKTYSILREVIRQEAKARGENASQLQAKIWIAADREVEAARLLEKGHHPGMAVGEKRDDRLLREIMKEKIDRMLSGEKPVVAPPTDPGDIMKNMVDKVLRMQKGKGA